MRTVDHKKLAEILILRYMQNIPQKYRTAFYFGCIEPDYNPFSYLHGFLKSYTFYGHNFNNVKNFLDVLFRRLNNARRHGYCFYFHLGLLIHYITDAFTHAHTALFSGSLHQHSQYEQQLHLAFEKMIYSTDFRLPSDFLPCSDISEVNRLHKIYSNENISVYNDLLFIFNLATGIMENFCREYGYSVEDKIIKKNNS